MTAPPEVGSLERALANGQRLLGSDPEAAAEQAREILSGDDKNSDALRLLAKALRLLKRNREAERAEIQAVEAAAFVPELVRAGQAILEGGLEQAEQSLRAYLQKRPDDAAAVRLLAEVAGRAGHLADAERLLRRAIELAPAFSEARLKLSTILTFQNRVKESLAVLDELLALDPQSRAGLNSKAANFARIGEYSEAAGVYQHMLKLHPTNVSGWISYGQILNTIGRFEESVAAYRQVLAIDRTRGEAWWSLANLKTSRFSSDDIEAMKAALGGPDGHDDSHAYLHFALGKALEEAGEYKESFDHYDRGNRIRAKRSDYRPEDTHALVDRSKIVFSKEFFEERAGAGEPDRAPIFIIGMPRAGSTLVEQILASHSSIEGTAELQYMALLRRRLSQEPGKFPDKVGELSTEQLTELGREYLASSKPHRKTGKPYFTDKLPNNWEHVGFILAVLPNCRIIDARRHPMACCFSTYKQLFGIGQEFTYSLDWLGHYYRDYVRMMDHFDRLFPGRIHRVIHEELIDNPEWEVERLLNYVGVGFEDNCLRFYENDRAVRTPSAEQVRRPLNREGVDRWRPFEPYLGELKAALGSVVEAYPAVPEDIRAL